jgi:hypothetical protein
VATARRCVFCDAPANSREHAFPAWLTKVAPGTGPVVNFRESGAVTWKTGGFDQKIRHVCATCNQGWMSELEQDSMDLVTSLIVEQRTSPLGTQEQVRLSTWLYKTGIMLSLAYPPENQYVPRDDYHYFYEHRKPPDGTSVWIASIIPLNASSGTYQLGWASPERLDFARPDGTPIEPAGYRLSFSVIALICQIMRDPHGGTFARPREYRDVWTRIRPISKGQWPPGRQIAAEGLEGVAGGKIFRGREPRTPS